MNTKNETNAGKQPSCLWRMVRLLLSDKIILICTLAGATMSYASFAVSGQWGAAHWCAVAALMSLLYYDRVRKKGATINQTDIEADKELAEAVETINEYVKRRDASPNHRKDASE